MELDRIYENRFPAEDRDAKDAVWRVLCQHFFQRYVGTRETVLDLGAGFCEFLRHIQCGARIAVDLNPDLPRFAPPGTRIVAAPSHALGASVGDGTVDVVFVSNFFEHLPDKSTLLLTLSEIRRVLRPGGRLLVLQPNLRAVGAAYWDFIDHHIALTDRSLAEAVSLSGLRVTELVPRFLPYTTRSRTPQHPVLVRLYLLCRPLWWIMGGQAWLVATKPNDEAR